MSQTSPTPGLPKEPLAILKAAAPHYNFNDAAMKPFHLKATHQLYDEAGQPSEKGSYEYWWVSPEVNRSTWMRSGGTHSDWHTADGKHEYVGTGESLKFFEYKLQSALFSPLPKESDLDPSIVRLDLRTEAHGEIRVPCIELVPKTSFRGRIQDVPLGLFPTYCFDPELPVLRISYSWGTLTTAFDKIAVVRDQYLAREIEMFEGKGKILTAEVETFTGLGPNDPALTPSADASVSGGTSPVGVGAEVANGFLLKKEIPVYPEDAKQARISGTVILQATIGMDGGIHDLRIVSTPSPSLAVSALWSVSHWQYKPYLLNGQPVEIRTTINVIFSLGR
jgi:TonB family protein